MGSDRGGPRNSSVVTVTFNDKEQLMVERLASLRERIGLAEESAGIDPDVGDVSDEEVKGFLAEHIVPVTRPDLPPEGRDPLLAPWKAGPFRTGYLDEIHGDGGAECTAYSPTQHELLVIARHWLRRRLDIRLDWFYFQRSSSSGIRLEPYASKRLSRIAGVIGKAAVEEVVTEVEEEQRRRMGEEDWRVFVEGTDEERNAIVEKTNQGIKGGGCPICGGHSGGLRFAQTDVFWCEEDRVRWSFAVGDSSTRAPAGVTLEDQQRQWDKIGLSGFEKVVPRPPGGAGAKPRNPVG